GGLGYTNKKSLGLGDLTPSMLMQIRYTTMYPVPYLSYQLYCYTNDKIFLDPTKPISLPRPAVAAMGLLGPLNVESPFSHLACALQHQTAGLELRNLRWHYAYYSSIFAGYQLVDWILVNFDGVSKRPNAAACGNRLMERGLFFSVQRSGPFMDGYHFYAFTDTAIESKSQLILASHTQSGRGQSSQMSSVGLADKANRYVPNSNNASPSASRPSSRQGSNAPSMYNNDGDTTTTSVPSIGAKKNISFVNSSALIGSTAKSTSMAGGHDTATESSSDSRSTGAQPASKLRVRTDIDSQQPKLSIDATDAQSSNADSGPHVSADSATTSASHRPDITSQQPEQLQVPGSRTAVAGSSRSASTTQQQSPGGEPLSANDYRKTSDVYPELSRRYTRRPLPKQLHQSREFKLDLDLQRKSARVENCLVHLDAVQNPMTCFHLSINWLNCTNHLVDEMAQGWARMAERCGMRLVEAPRAQDTVLDDNHPFHSPIRINLDSGAPPPVEKIFDDDWVHEFSFFGDDDSEPETSPETDSADNSDSDNETSSAASSLEANADLPFMKSRARIVRRMAKCLPRYAFERELLEDQDFILDVEAETNYPDSSMLQRTYTFDRQGHRYTQYVHRSGTAFVQICGPGQFLWINNYLFTSHQSHLRPQAANQQQQQQQHQQQQQQQPPGNNSGVVGSSQTGLVAVGASQVNLGVNGGRTSDALTMTDIAATPNVPPLQPVVGRHNARVQASGSGENIALPSQLSGNRMIPSYYPARNARDMWAHQVLESAKLDKHEYKRKSKAWEDTYKLQIVDHVG
ncbi:vacuolar membrane-associated protein iml1, partial [Coemansia aciculifera]